MDKKFFIKKICAELPRPQHSKLFDEYFENYIHHYILVPKNIIYNAEPEVWLIFMFMSKGLYGNEELTVFPAETLEDGELIQYPVYIPLEAVFEDDDVTDNLIRLYFEAVSKFFTANFSHVTDEDISDMRSIMDMEYLRSLALPVAEEEQGYIGNFSEDLLNGNI